jgi:hypothetical protein
MPSRGMIFPTAVNACLFSCTITAISDCIRWGSLAPQRDRTAGIPDRTDRRMEVHLP